MAQRFLGSLISAVAIAGVLGAPASSLAAGGPPPFTALGGETVNGIRYLAQPGGHGTTKVREVADGAMLRSRTVAGTFVLPAVTISAEAGGLSADRGTLVLVHPRLRVAEGPTHMLILDARNLRVRQRLALKGAFTFDAMSPDGSTMYLIQYLSPRDQTRYAVRAYDVEAGRLDPTPIVDPDEHAGEMRGYPLHRVTSPDGRWAYTLYDGGADGEPFVHALDTVEGRAVCVDLDGLVARDETGRVDMAMDPDTGQLALTARKVPLAFIDTGSLEASAPGAAPSDTNDGGGFPWILVVIVAGLALVGGGTAMAVRHRRESGLAAPDA